MAILGLAAPYPARVLGRPMARTFFGVTCAVVTFGLVLQLVLSIVNEGDDILFATAGGRVVNFFSFFTVLSNIIVAATTGMLAANPARASSIFRALRLNGVVAIAVTGVVFHIALADLTELTGWSWLADFLLHTASPILTVGGWLLFGPRGHVRRRIVVLSVVPPVIWIIYALIRGALVHDRFGNDYYPYPFMNVQEHGYPIVLVNVTVVALLFLTIAFGLLLVDRRLPGPRPRR